MGRSNDDDNRDSDGQFASRRSVCGLRTMGCKQNLMLNPDFSEEQKLYLQGFMSGSSLARASNGYSGMPGLMAPAANSHVAPLEPIEVGPDALGRTAQNKVLAQGHKLTEQEVAKRERHPLDQWDDIRRHSAENRFPKGADVLSFKYFGLFYVAPAQNSYMCRLRFAGGLVTSAQMRVLAEIAREQAGGYAHVTTRSNFQIREIGAGDGYDVLCKLHEAGIVPKGSGADNIRNITGSVTAGIDAQEIYDTRALCREMLHYIYNHREFYGLPRKFNIAFDGGGTINTLEETNDIGFQAVEVGANQSVSPGVYFRMMLGGITGHQDFARDVGILLKPQECVPIAGAVLRVFIAEGDRTDRKKARLKYVLDRLGFEKFMEMVREQLDFEPVQFPLENCEPRPRADRMAHIGVHPQKQDGLFYIGVALPVGKLEAAQIAVLAVLAESYGDGEIRLTPWQNLLIAGVKAEDIETVKAELENIGLGWNANSIRAGLVACTGSFGCKFGLADTKKNAMEIAQHVESKLELDAPLNIHVTGCPNSCAQHYIGDIGLMGVKVEVEDDMVDGYHIVVGGGFGAQAGIGRSLYEEVVAEDAPQTIERMLQCYLAKREAGENFLEWSRRHSVDELKTIFAEQVMS